MLLVSITLIGAGTLLMVTPKEKEEAKSKFWLLFSVLSAVFAATVSIFIKIGLKDMQSDLGTLIRTIIVFIFASTLVIARKEYKGVSKINSKSRVFLTLSGFATGGAWLCEYYALNINGVNPVAVNSIGKLAILLRCYSHISF